MTQYELLTLLTSVLATVISTVALYRGHRLGKEQVELQSKQAELAALQHKMTVHDAQEQSTADLRAFFIGSGTRWRMILENAGRGAARNVRLADATGNMAPEPLIVSECERHFPLTEPRPGQSIALIAALHLGIGLPVPMIVTWDDDSGVDHQREIHVTRA